VPKLSTEISSGRERLHKFLSAILLDDATELNMKKSLGAKVLVTPSPVWCIGTYDEHNQPNVMTASWAGICCSKPPAVSVSLRKATYSYSSIVQRRAFTVSVPSRAQVEAADYFGIDSGRDADKFARTGLTPVKAEHVDAPYVGEFPMVLECTLIHSLEIGMHTLFVGEIVDVKVDDTCLDEQGTPVANKLDPFIYTAAERRYYAIGKEIGKAFDIGKR
jgi:flavin reductase (DIM6/NTAB) family NADH-FMN oxidoreductase RutF